MQRATDVRVSQSVSSKRKSPPVRDGGPSKAKVRNADRPIDARLDRAFRAVAQARACVGEMMRLQRELADFATMGGNVFAAVRANRPKLEALYREAYTVYAAGHAAGGNFAALAGVEFGALERALEGIGWLLADDATRARVGASRWFSVGPEGLVAHG